MKKKTPLSTLLPFLALLLPALSWAATPLDYCDRQFEQNVKSVYALGSLDEYRGHLREVLKYSRQTLQDYVDAEDGSIDIPLPIVRDILLAGDGNRETKEFVDKLRFRYQPSPQLPLSPKDFDDFASRVLDNAIVARRNECKTTCSECLANANGKQNGILYRVHGDKKGIFAVTFTYLPERESDKDFVTVSGITVTGGGVLETPDVIRRSTVLHRYNRHTQKFRRTDPKLGVTIRVDFQGRESVQIFVSDRRPEAGSPVGTVLSSILPWEKYAEATNDPLPYDSRLSYWAPCDGRSIDGSRLQDIIGKTNAPDLRGMFLRGLNQFAPGDEKDKLVGSVHERQRDPGPRDADGFQGDNVGGHEHTFNGGRADDKVAINYNHVEHNQNGAWYAGDYAQRAKRKTGNNPGGETRPKNIAVHYYIKIN